MSELEQENADLRHSLNGREREVAYLTEQVAGLVKALEQIAALNDRGGNLHLKQTGSYACFDEPGSVQMARAALSAHKEGSE